MGIIASKIKVFLGPTGYMQRSFGVSLPILHKDLIFGTNRQPGGRHHGVYLVRKPHPKKSHDKKIKGVEKWNFFSSPRSMRDR